jgi:ribonuclease inhibitor
MFATIDGALMGSEQDFHLAISAALRFPQYYGQNLDALWDVMADVERPIRLVWRNAEGARPAMPDRFDVIIELLRAVEARDQSLGLVDRFTLVLE